MSGNIMNELCILNSPRLSHNLLENSIFCDDKLANLMRVILKAQELQSSCVLTPAPPNIKQSLQRGSYHAGDCHGVGYLPVRAHEKQAGSTKPSA